MSRKKVQEGALEAIWGLDAVPQTDIDEEIGAEEDEEGEKRKMEKKQRMRRCVMIQASMN